MGNAAEARPGPKLFVRYDSHEMLVSLIPFDETIAVGWE
jgi:hypothetical protein